MKWGKVFEKSFQLIFFTPSLQGLGCDFALKSCKDWMESRARKGLSIHPYCNKVAIEIWSRKAYIVIILI